MVFVFVADAGWSHLSAQNPSSGHDPTGLESSRASHQLRHNPPKTRSIIASNIIALVSSPRAMTHKPSGLSTPSSHLLQRRPFKEHAYSAVHTKIEMPIEKSLPNNSEKGLRGRNRPSELLSH
jgi:hypothetical protein